MLENTKQLKDFSFFADLSDDQLDDIGAGATEEMRPKGYALFQQGDHSDCCYLILKGAVAVTIHTEDSDQEFELGVGDFFGEIGMLRGTLRTATAEVSEMATLIRVEKAGFDRMMSVDADFAAAVMKVSQKRLDDLRQGRPEAAEPTEEKASLGRVVVFYSARGGAGTSMLATNFAKKMADLSRRKICLVDADLEYGSCHTMLAGETCKILPEALAKCEDPPEGEEVELPRQAVLDSLVELPHGFHLLPAPGRLEDVARYTKPRLEALCEVLQQEFEYVIVDTPSSLSDSTLAMLEFADDVYCVITNDRVALDRALRSIALLRKAGYPTERFRFVLNNASERGFDRDEVEKTLDRHVTFQVSRDESAVLGSLNRRRLMVEEDPERQVAIDVMNAARAYLLPFGHLEEGTEDLEQKKSRAFSLWQLLGLG